MPGFDHWIDDRGVESKQKCYENDSLESGIDGVVPWGREYRRKSIGTCVGHKDCFKKVMYRCCYRYITGKAGRISFQERFYCDNHAEKFANKYGIEFKSESAHPTVRPVRESKGAVENDAKGWD